MKQFRDSNYYISPNGQVINIKTNKIIKSRIDNYGYYIITIYLNNKPKTFKVHRLVAECYIPNIGNKSQVHHKDFNSLNNNVNNLEWVTPKENINYSIQEGNIDLDKFNKEREKYINSDKAKENGRVLGLKYKYQNLKQYNSDKI